MTVYLIAQGVLGHHDPAAHDTVLVKELQDQRNLKHILHVRYYPPYSQCLEWLGIMQGLG